MLPFRVVLETEADNDNYGERPDTPLVPNLNGESVVTVTADAYDRSNTFQSYELRVLRDQIHPFDLHASGEKWVSRTGTAGDPRHVLPPSVDEPFQLFAGKASVEVLRMQALGRGRWPIEVNQYVRGAKGMPGAGLSGALSRCWTPCEYQ